VSRERENFVLLFLGVLMGEHSNDKQLRERKVCVEKLLCSELFIKFKVCLIIRVRTDITKKVY
jgi:hypothetical protein